MQGCPLHSSTGLTPGSHESGFGSCHCPHRDLAPASHLPRLPVVLTLITQCWNGLLIYYFPLLSDDLWSDLHSHRAGAWGSKKKSVLKCVNKCSFLLDWLTSPARTLHALWTNCLLCFLHLFFFSLPLCPQWWLCGCCIGRNTKSFPDNISVKILWVKSQMVNRVASGQWGRGS